MGEDNRISGSGTSSDKGKPARTRLGCIIGAVVAGVLAVAAIAAVVLVALYPSAQTLHVTGGLRDIAIIVLALVSILIGILLLVLMFQVQSLIALLRDEIQPILHSTSQAARTVRGTSAFLSDAVVNPVISVASYASGIRATFRALRKGQRRRRVRQASEHDPTDK